MTQFRVSSAPLMESTVKPGGSLLAGGAWCPARNELGTIRYVASPPSPCLTTPGTTTTQPNAELLPTSAHIQRNPARLRSVIASPAFVSLFGEAKPLPKGGRRNIFGQEDELKTAPKGVDKTHKCFHPLAHDGDLTTDGGGSGTSIFSSAAHSPWYTSQSPRHTYSFRNMLIGLLHYRSFTDAQVLSPTFKEDLCEAAAVLRPFVHWCVSASITLPLGYLKLKTQC